jgi:hypothetical protein
MFVCSKCKEHCHCYVCHQIVVIPGRFPIFVLCYYDVVFWVVRLMMMYELFAAKFEVKKPNAACSMALTAVRSHRISWHLLQNWQGLLILPIRFTELTPVLKGQFSMRISRLKGRKGRKRPNGCGCMFLKLDF